MARSYGSFKHPVMRWSIYHDPHGIMDALEPNAPAWKEREAFNAQELVLDAPEGVADGVYDFTTTLTREQGFHGVVVEGGKFDPELTAHAVYIALVYEFGQDKFDHIFIEALRWDGIGFFDVSLGS